MSNEKWEIRVAECEHEGDLDHYASELHVCGAIIADQRIDPYEYEEGVITVIIPTKKEVKEEFWKKLQDSEIDGFIDSRSFICKIN